MLGHVVARYLTEQDFDVVTSERRYVASSDCALFDYITISRADDVVNCIGLIKQKDVTVGDLFLMNTLLPVQLTQKLSSSQRVNHISSDCVFSGKKGNYTVQDTP